MNKKRSTNIGASVRQRLLNQAKIDKRTFSELLQYFAMDRFLYRMSISDYAESFIQQYAGRLHRQYDGKKEVRIYDYLDDSLPMLARMYKRRLRGYKSIGYEIIEPDSAHNKKHKVRPPTPATGRREVLSSKTRKQ